jgi:hypothetical protein
MVAGIFAKSASESMSRPVNSVFRLARRDSGGGLSDGIVGANG